MDPNGDGIDLSELTRAFRRSRQRNARQLMESGARVVLAQLCQRLRTDPSSAASGVAVLEEAFIGEGGGLCPYDCSRTDTTEVRRVLIEKAGDGPKLGEKAIKVVLRFLDPNDEGCDGIGKVELERAVALARRAARVEQQYIDSLDRLARDNARLDEKWIKAGMPPPLTDADIDTMVTKCFDPSGDGMIEFLELYEAVSRARRAKAEEKHILAGKTVLRALIERLGKLDLTLKQWFDLMDDSGAAKSDATVTTRELKAGLAKVKATRGVLLLSLDEMNTLLRYIDTTGDGDLSYLEVQQAVAKLDVPTASEELGAALGDKFERFEEALKGQRLVGFFGQCDKASRGVITIPELKVGLRALMMPSGRIRAMLKDKENKVRQLQAEYAQRCEDTKRAAFHGLECEECGAAEVLRQLEARVYDRGQKIATLFVEADASGDGLISAEELTSLLVKMTVPSVDVRKSRHKRQRALHFDAYLARVAKRPSAQAIRPQSRQKGAGQKKVVANSQKNHED